ncbi:MAG: amidase [Planctomycetota bacterium]|jgi:Asp-tRNA(Asn)/Glu-tRNA(Gln) amidotransferase A subunit family amidase
MVHLASRREFLRSSGLLAAAPVWSSRADGRPSQEQSEPGLPPTLPEQAQGAPAALTESTLAEAEKLAAIELTEAERTQALEGISEQVDRFRMRRRWPLGHEVAPAGVFDPRLPGMKLEAGSPRVVRSPGDPGPLPADDRDIAYAPVTALARWIERGELSSRRLTEIYLDRLRRIGPWLECVITLTEDRALAEAREADREIEAGRYRGPLHGIPWGAKDLFDTAGTRTTWGAEPYRDRIPTADAAVVERLTEAGAVLVAKLSLGALAYGDIWFGGRTNSPWKLEQGSRGSSAGSAAGTAAGLVGFSLGTETQGSIVSPCMRCGTTGLRPTFGRVARAGAMSLCWSLDKIGPICRTAEDCGLVLAAINGRDAADPSSLDVPLDFDATRPVKGMRVGYDPAWFDQGATDIDRSALDAARAAGLALVEVKLPAWPYEALKTILFVEAAAAFDELTLTDADDELVWQKPEAWPNTFRQTRFVPAVEYVQAQRFRRQVMEMMAEKLDGLQAMISPSYAGSLLLITNNTGHPSLTIRAGFKDDGTPHGITLWGRLFDEGTLCRIGMALEEQLGVWGKRPELG